MYVVFINIFKYFLIKFINNYNLQETGNIVIASKCILSIFRMVIKTHDISRLWFLDFDTWPMIMNLKFNVCGLQIEQDIVTAFGERKVQVFQIIKGIC